MQRLFFWQKHGVLHATYAFLHVSVANNFMTVKISDSQGVYGSPSFACFILTAPKKSTLPQCIHNADPAGPQRRDKATGKPHEQGESD